MRAGGPGKAGGSGPPGLDERMRVLHVICLALALAPVLFGAVAFYLLQADLFEPVELGVARWALIGVALVLLGAAPAIQRRVDHAGGGGASEPEIFQGYQNAVVVGFALREGAGLLGAVTGLLVGSTVWVAALVIAAFLSMLVAWPRRAVVEARLRRSD